MGMHYVFRLVLQPYNSCRKSGAGDHGKEGIKTFVDQHDCVQKCTLMGLKALSESEEEEDAGEGGDGSE
jgi:hypothetical protein